MFSLEGVLIFSLIWKETLTYTTVYRFYMVSYISGRFKSYLQMIEGLSLHTSTQGP